MSADKQIHHSGLTRTSDDCRGPAESTAGLSQILAQAESIARQALRVPAISNINARNEYGESALHCVVEANNELLLCALLAHPDIDLNATVSSQINPYFGMTPFHYAVMDGSVEILGRLCQHPGLRMDALTPAGENALHLTGNEGYMDYRTLACLLSYPALTSLVNLSDSRGNTVLHLAVKQGQVFETNDDLEAVRLLIEAGGNPLCTNSHGETPLDLATKTRSKKLIAVLSKPL